MAVEGFVAKLQELSCRASCRSPLLIGAWVRGYAYVDRSAANIWRQTACVFAGPDGADAASRVLLSFSSDGAAFDALLCALQATASELDLASEISEQAQQPWLESSCEHLLQHPGVILGEPTMERLTSQLDGYLAALDVTFPRRAKAEREQLEAFEKWLQAEHGCPHATWGGIIRAYSGEAEAGLRSFVHAWVEFTSG